MKIPSNAAVAKFAHVANLILILQLYITSLESQYGKFSSQYDSRVVNYNCKVLYKIDHWHLVKDAAIVNNDYM